MHYHALLVFIVPLSVLLSPASLVPSQACFPLPMHWVHTGQNVFYIKFDVPDLARQNSTLNALVYGSLMLAQELYHSLLHSVISSENTNSYYFTSVRNG